VDQNFLPMIQKHHAVLLEECPTDIVAADGRPLRVCGVFKAIVEVMGKVFEHPVLVADLGGQCGLLGYDMLRRLGAKIDCDRELITVDGVRLGVTQSRVKCCSRVYMAERLVVPPESQCIVKARLQENSNLSGACVVEAYDELTAKTGILVERALVDVEAGLSVTMTVTNASDKPVLLQLGRTLGSAEEIQEVLDSEGDGLVKERCLTVGQMDSSQFPVGVEETESRILPEHLLKVLEKISPEVTDEERAQLSDLLFDYQDVFAIPGGGLGRNDWVLHEIDTGDSPPIKQAPRRVPYQRQKVIDDEVEKMLELGVIEPSDSPWSSPVVLVAKKTGEVRFCVDYGKLNEVTRKDAYPLPHINTHLESLAGSRWFSTLDLASGYWQMSMAPQDKPKTAFVTRKGLYQFSVLPFGLVGAVANFSRLMARVLNGITYTKCLVYIDDTIIMGRDFQELLDNLGAVLQRFRLAILKVKPSKTHLFQTECQFSRLPSPTKSPERV
jgi:hypothetical protein